MHHVAKDTKRDLTFRILKWKEWGNFQEGIKTEFLESISNADCCMAWTLNKQLLEKILDLANWMEHSVPAVTFCPWCGHSIKK